MPRKHLGAAASSRRGRGLSGRYSTPIIAHAGLPSLQYGYNHHARPGVRQGSGQSEANSIAGYRLAEPTRAGRASRSCSGQPPLPGHRPAGLAGGQPERTDSKRGIVWVDKRFVPRTVSMTYDPETELLLVNAAWTRRPRGISVTGDTLYRPEYRQPGHCASSFPGWNGVATWNHGRAVPLLPASIMGRSTPKGSPSRRARPDRERSRLRPLRAGGRLLRPVIATDQGCSGRHRHRHPVHHLDQVGGQ